MVEFEQLRQKYHRELCRRVIFLKEGGIPSMADIKNKPSIRVAKGIVERMSFPLRPSATKGQTSGADFAKITRDFLEEAFGLLNHLRPGAWQFTTEASIDDFDQYRHLAELSEVVDTHPELKTILGDYLVTADIVSARIPVSDDEINTHRRLVEGGSPPRFAPLRAANSSNPRPILHACVSCKWTLRSDRGQVARTEGLNLMRNRKGHTPHVVAVTGEPLPSRIASLAMGTGDLDCVYHFALHELTDVVEQSGDESLKDILSMMVNGRRLRDIADLPFDLAA